MEPERFHAANHRVYEVAPRQPEPGELTDLQSAIYTAIRRLKRAEVVKVAEVAKTKVRRLVAKKRPVLWPTRTVLETLKKKGLVKERPNRRVAA